SWGILGLCWSHKTILAAEINERCARHIIANFFHLANENRVIPARVSRHHIQR
ncbi:MAG: hypothetical protein RLZZ20_2584, partial [Pseudomonadota bacterium]